MKNNRMILHLNVEMPERTLTAVPRSMMGNQCQHNDVEEGYCLDCGANMEYVIVSYSEDEGDEQ